MKVVALILAVAATVAGLVFAQQDGRQRGGPPGVFHTEFPASKLNVIEGAPTDRSILFSVLASEDGKVEVAYGVDKLSFKAEANVAAGVPKDIEITGLLGDTEYKFTATSSTAKVDGNFHTARKPGDPFTFDVQADSHLDENTSTEVYENTLHNEVLDKPDFLVDLGDTFMVDKYAQYTDSLKQYQAQRYWFSIPGSQMPVFLCLGNHDGETGWRQRGGDDVSAWSRKNRQFYFPSVTHNSFYSGAPSAGLYYAWTWGDALFVVLDPFIATTQKPRAEGDGWNWSLGKTQFEWLVSTLKSSHAKHKFLFIHHLVGGFGREARGGVEASSRFEWGDDAEFPTMRTGWAEPIHALMKKYGVDALFHGHDHLYVRQERDGIQYFEVAQPSSSRENTRSAEEYGYKSGKLLASPGHMRITVSPNSVKYEYIKSRLVGTNREVVDRLESAGNPPRVTAQ